MENRLARAQIERCSHLQVGGDALHRKHVAAVVVAALADLGCQVGNLQQGGLRLVFGHKAAHPGHTHDAALLDQFAQGAVHSHAGDAELGDQVVLGRQPVSGAPDPFLDPPGNVVLDLLVQGHGLRGRRRAVGRMRCVGGTADSGVDHGWQR